MKCLEGITKREGRCYELTTKIMLQEPNAAQWLLVHGRLHYGKADREPSLHHAWIDLGGGQMFDIHQGYLSFQKYREGIGGVVVDHVYTRDEVVAHTRFNRGVLYRSALLRTDGASYTLPVSSQYGGALNG